MRAGIEKLNAFIGNPSIRSSNLHQKAENASDNLLIIFLLIFFICCLYIYIYVHFSLVLVQSVRDAVIAMSSSIINCRVKSLVEALSSIDSKKLLLECTGAQNNFYQCLAVPPDFSTRNLTHYGYRLDILRCKLLPSSQSNKRRFSGLITCAKVLHPLQRSDMAEH